MRRSAEPKPVHHPSFGLHPSWMDAAALLWMAVVISGYSRLATAIPRPTREAVPGIAEAERTLGPLLLCLGLAAIIRYFLGRQPEAAEPGDEPAHRPETGRDTA